MFLPSNTRICASPSASLPSFSKLLGLTSAQIDYSLNNLRLLYGRQPLALPPKLSLPVRRHQQLIHDESVPDSGYASAEEEQDDLDEEDTFVSSSEDESLEVLRADPLERAFAIKWITGFISRSDTWTSADGLEDAESDKRAEAVDNATKLLSLLLSSDEQLEEEEDCSVTRTFRFFPPRGAVIEAELNDAPLSDEDHTCVGLQSWASSIVLSEQICANPSRFSLSFGNSGGTDTPLRILELGAGTGLLSIVAAKLLPPTTSPSIFATDYHPDVLVNLRANIATNFPGTAPPISVHQLDWEFPDYSTPMNVPFDLILGADVVYHPDHARWIKACAERLLLRPNSSCGGKGGVFWLMMALRISGRHEGMSHTVEDIFPDASSLSSSQESDLSKKEENEWQLAVLEKSELGKLRGVGRADERGYLLFKIGWIPC